jgi:hypothetical protein
MVRSDECSIGVDQSVPLKQLFLDRAKPMLLYKLIVSQVLTICLLNCCFGMVDSREWSDASGHYKFNADLIAYDDEHVVLQKENEELISIAIKDLSEADLEYLKSTEAKEKLSASADSSRTFTMKSGLKVLGTVVEYGERELKIQRYLRGKVYVNDRDFENLPAIYKAMVPEIVAHLENIKIDGEEGLHAWLKQQPAKPRNYTCQGVILQLENGDRYGVPFFLFSDADRVTLENGWKRHQAAQEDEERQAKEEFYLRAQAQANADEIRAMREISEVNLQISAYNAGVFDLWEVTLYPAQGNFSRPMTVVVPGRDSRQASQNALQKYPNARVGPVARVRGRNRLR